MGADGVSGEAAGDSLVAADSLVAGVSEADPFAGAVGLAGDEAPQPPMIKARASEVIVAPWG